MEQKAVDILNRHHLMTIATLRADGWPQATMVSYANDGLLLYFVISRASQKYANIERDSRVSIAVGDGSNDSDEIRALSIAANASEVRDPAQRDHALHLLFERNPGLARIGRPDHNHAAVMRAWCSIVTIIDFSKGAGHSDMLTVGPGGVEMMAARDDDWGFSKVDAGA